MFLKIINYGCKDKSGLNSSNQLNNLHFQNPQKIIINFNQSINTTHIFGNHTPPNCFVGRPEKLPTNITYSSGGFQLRKQEYGDDFMNGQLDSILEHLPLNIMDDRVNNSEDDFELALENKTK